ncbi:MAG: hypothetical protein U1D30_08520 [Planctomycetota bacterium]
MAFEWVSKIKKYLPTSKSTTVADADAYLPPPPSRSESTVPPSPFDLWMRTARGGIPVAMLIVGGMLAGFTELIGIWAILGYGLIAAAPIVFFLHRIELRLTELRNPESRGYSGSKSSSRSGGSKYD